jgi:lipopolysaccharide heptosyltransferase II
MNRLVILAPNWLGDAVMALPAIADVRRQWPDARITIAARPSIAPLFDLAPGLDGIMDVEQLNNVDMEFDTALLLPNSFRSALLVKRAGIPERWGYRTEWRAALLTRGVMPPRGLHQAEYYQHLVQALGAPNGSIEPRLVVGDEVREMGRRLLAEVGWNGVTPLVALAPGAAYGGAKRWPAESFAELARALASDGVRSVMIGSAADATTATDVARRFDGVWSVVGRTDLPALAGVLANCCTLVTNDSGAMHLAAACGVRVTAVFGPTDERATRPLGDAHVVIVNPVWCRPCMLRECPLDHRCLRGVAAAEVAAAARRVL